MTRRKTGRNDPCPCGSGKKYKRCCLALHTSAGYTQIERLEVRIRLHTFAGSDNWSEAMDDAIRIYRGQFADALEDLADDLREHSEQTFSSWFWFDYRSRDGRRIVERFLEYDSDLSSGERRYLEQMPGTAVHLYEIETLVAGASLTLHDLLTDGRTTVMERTASRTMRRWDIIAARVAPSGASGQPELEDVISLPQLARTALAEKLRDEFRSWRDTNPQSDDLDYFETLGPQCHRAWLEIALPGPLPPVLMTTSLLSGLSGLSGLDVAGILFLSSRHKVGVDLVEHDRRRRRALGD